MRRPEWARVCCVAILALGGLAPTASAQQDTTGIAADSGAAPAADTVPARRITLPQPEPAVPQGPLAPGTRLTLTRDSLLWSGAATLADLLTRIPGVYVARAGFLGQPEYIQYGGRGGAALEVYWDGVRMEPLGTDSLFIDAGRIPLSYLQRVDLEVLPATLRVYLVSERHDGLTPRSTVRFATGPFETGAYAALFQHRWRNGIGIDVAADVLDTQGFSGPGRNDQAFDLWAKLSWLPSPSAGVTYQVRRHDYERPVVNTEGGGVAVPAHEGTRTDFLFTLFGGSALSGRGLRAEGGVGVSRWSPDSVSPVAEQLVREAHARFRYRADRWSAALEGRVSDARTLGALEARAGWVPVAGVVLSGRARWRRHSGERTSRDASASFGIYRGPFSLVGELVLSDALQAPSLLADTTIETVDHSVRLGVDTGPLDAMVGLVRRDAFAPLPFPDLALVSGMTPVPVTDYVIADVRLWSSKALSAGARYSDPLDDVTADLQPPTQTRADITFRSKFWRTFRSGAFDLMARLSMEAWSTGTAGLDAAGVPIVLPGATFYNMYVQFQIVGFTMFWDFRNARLTEAEFVPGLAYPRQAQTFGISFEFFN